ncbi:uncharacterized protein LOC131220116 [Magnolia sinica]|uniref:uncharacterized protein LOC131220116 n=1 Tax=Magnolia sinica TaxID=86752 RepID=UPI00265A2AB4|nr:uncharacterized protein LOC131220116 [Magnolia sinica]
MISLHKPGILVLLEPMLADSSQIRIGLRLGFHQSISNASHGGKIWDFHHHSISIDFISASEQFLTFAATMPALGIPLFFTCVYAKCSYVRRGELWGDLAAQSSVFAGPWIVCGDFNAVTSNAERIGGNSLSTTSSREFQAAINQASLQDAGFSGNAFTWCNNRSGPNRKWTRLDRALCSSAWLHLLPSFLVQHLPRIHSDHSPLLLSSPTIPPSSPKPFRFQRMWTQDQRFLALLSTAKVEILEQNASHVPSPLTLDCFHQEKKNLERLELLEEVFWKQKSRNRRLKEGDRNLRFFHASASDRFRKAQIRELTLQDGSKTSDLSQMKQVASEFFKALYSAEPTNSPNNFTVSIPALVSSAENYILLAPPTMEEVHLAVKALPLEGASGPDGFSCAFFASCWHIIREDIQRAIKFLLQGGKIPRVFSATLLCLIPKSAAPKTLSDFRPISLYNCIYKIFSKVITARLSSILPKLISKEQMAFVQGRSVSKRIALVQELLKDIDRKVRGHNTIFKIDLEKAYDRLSWSFLKDVLLKFGFSTAWVAIVEGYWSSLWLSVLFNGESSGFFKSGRGLRQGDPLSPSLFILGLEALSRGLSALIPSIRCQPFRSTRFTPTISHILFADDTMIFTNSGARSVRNLMSFLQGFSRVSGLKINSAKSCLISSSKMPSSRIRKLEGLTGFARLPPYFTYLGVPRSIGRLRSSYFQPLVDKILSHISGWKARFLNQAARSVPIKHVLAGIPIHTLAAVDIPSKTLAMLESGFADFFWGWTEGNNLWAVFMRAKYGIVSSRPPLAQRSATSPAWKKLLQQFEFLMDHSRLLVGEGSSNFWDTNWSGMGLLRHHILGDIPTHLQELQIKDFTGPEGLWPGVTVPSSLPAEVCDHIASDGISLTSGQDVWVWTAANFGEFLVNSAWQITRQFEEVQTSHARAIDLVRNWFFRLASNFPLPPAKNQRDRDAISDLRLPLREGPPRGISLINWTCPVMGCFKLNIDGSSLGNPGPSASGGVCRDHLGEFRFGFSKGYGHGSSFLAEVKAVVDGLSLCFSNGYTSVDVESDSLAVVDLLSGSSKPLWFSFYWLKKCSTLRARGSIAISYIPREGNQLNWFSSKMVKGK